MVQQETLEEKAVAYLNYIDTLIATIQKILDDKETLERYYKNCKEKNILETNPYELKLFLIGMSNGIRITVGLEKHYLTDTIGVNTDDL